MAETSASLILLTYKGKVLLMHKSNGVLDEQNHPWCLIEGIPKNKESYEAAMSRTVEKETGVKIENIEFVEEHRYHAALTDDNINKMKRGEFQLLDFFTIKDLQKLFLTDATRDFVSKYGHLTTKTQSLTGV
jgi:NADH pyrophosphatase NudC (nudix superfamily)